MPPIAPQSGPRWSGDFRYLAQKFVFVGPERVSLFILVNHLSLDALHGAPPGESLLIQVRQWVWFLSGKTWNASLERSHVCVLQLISFVEVSGLERLDVLPLASCCGPEVTRNLDAHEVYASPEFEVV